MKYIKRNIMRNAWAIRKSANVSMSVALKAAWALEKAMMAAEENGKNRTYISTRIYTNAWNCKSEKKVGYVDNLTGEFFAA